MSFSSLGYVFYSLRDFYCLAESGGQLFKSIYGFMNWHYVLIISDQLLWPLVFYLKQPADGIHRFVMRCQQNIRLAFDRLS